MSPRFVDITGERFGRLTAVRKESVKRTDSIWLCQCECGMLSSVRLSELRNGSTRSCGCLARELAGDRLRKQATSHGMSYTRTYRIWQAMIQRCTNPKRRGYSEYGGRGIEVCERWRSFDLFLADMGECPAGHTIERNDNDGNYVLSNCRWATPKEQAQNRRPRRSSL